MVQFSIARTQDDLRYSVELVREVYIKEGYINPDDQHDSGISVYLGKEGATTMLAHSDSRLLGTISIVSDVRGVPMDVIYDAELARYRERGARIGEVCQFAINKKALKESLDIAELDITVGLLGLSLQYGLSKAHDFLCFAINPKHRIFYESMGCVQIGEEKSYGSVSGAPALGYVLDMEQVRRVKAGEGKQHFILKKIFDTELPENFFI